jgi:hypothetical protein
LSSTEIIFIHCDIKVLKSRNIAVEAAQGGAR